ncbi:RNase P/MRP, p29 subunit [Auriscalpium vulgare]|uniref:RNase P/MRP, p29 subunit n=1 Tax=Auriscalpium vulgare TaxID=40419 RepID=A0ACB8S216_9AGAM|nr:RNase P/MRP, p29 subunit [Auriscalpium vulgare]
MFHQTTQTKYSSAAPFTAEYVQAHLATSNPQAIYDARVRRARLLLENPARVSRQKREREERRARQQREAQRKAQGTMGRKEAAEKGVWKLKKEEARFDLFIRLHRMWMDYMSELLGLATLPASGSPDPKAMPSSAGMHAKLVKADYHGSIMTVRRSKNPALVGVSGIVIQETENTLRVITRQNKLKLLPKHGSVFAFAVPLYSTLDATPAPTAPPAVGEAGPPEAPQSTPTVLDDPHIEFELYGNQFQFRAAERAGRKFKFKDTIEL